MPKKSRAKSTVGLIDQLESRLMFDASVTPTPAEQYALELINRARANPAAEITRLANDTTWQTATPNLNEGLPAGTISPAAEQPVAFNPLLTTGGRLHSQWIFNTQLFQHNEGTDANPITPRDRDIAAGYLFGATGQEGENISSGTYQTGGSVQAAVDYSQSLDITDQTAANRGHRRNMFTAIWNEIGIGAATGTYANIPAMILTEDYAYAGNGPFLTGISYNDLNQDNFYEPGEELGGVTITAVRASDNAVFSTATWSSGGYNLALTPGTYTVTATGGNVGSPAAQTVTIGTQNVEADFIAGTAQPNTPAAPVIINSPQPQSIPVNNQVSFAVSFSSNPAATVQWQVSTAGGAFTNIAGANGTLLNFSANADLDGNRYQAVIANSQGTIITTPVSLSVNNIPFAFGILPQPQVVHQGDTVTFTSSATGSGVTVQWQVSTDQGVTFTNIAGATNPTLTFIADVSQNGNIYKADYSDRSGEIGGGTAGLNVNAAPAAPTITAQPVNTAATVGGNATLTVGVTGANPTVQWQVQGNNGVTGQSLLTVDSINTASTQSLFNDIPGATGTTVTLPVPANGVTRYRAMVENVDGSVTTSVISVTANKRAVVSNDLASLQNAVKSALASLNTCKKFTTTLVSKLTADLRALKATKTQRALVSRLAADESASRIRFSSHQTAVFKALLKAARQANHDAAVAKALPDSSTAKSKLQSDLTALNTAAAASTAPADALDCRFATANPLVSISAIARTNTQLQNDINDGLTGAASIGQTLQAPVAVALQIASRLSDDAQD